jgi:hypothetical protein
MPRLNGLMALIAVMCIAGVVSSEMLGPMSRLRTWTHVSPGQNQARFIRAGLAGDAFVFAPAAPQLAPPPPAPPPRFVPIRRSPPPPVGSSVLILPARDEGDQGGPDPPAYQFSAEGLSGGISDANFDSSTWPTFIPAALSNIDSTWTGPSAVEAAPEPATWLMLILGLGGVGLALRRRRAGARAGVIRTPSGVSPTA